MKSGVFAKLQIDGVKNMQNGKIYKIIDSSEKSFKVKTDKGELRNLRRIYFSIPLILYINE